MAYCEKRRAGAFDHEAHCAAVAALQAVWPLPWKEASAEVTRAVHYASVYHKKWLWDGVRGEDNRVRIAPERRRCATLGIGCAVMGAPSVAGSSFARGDPV